MRNAYRAGLAIALFLAGCDSSREPSSGPANLSSGSVAVDGGSVYYETLGKGAPVILIHGGFGDRRMWDAQMEPLSQAFRVIRYDHRGFGKSSAPAKPYSPVADLVALMNHLQLKRANLVGNSMGGTLALDFALLQPDLTGAVVVVASTAGGYPVPEEDIKQVNEVLGIAKDKGTSAAIPLWLQHPMVAVASRHATAGPLLRTMVEDNQRMFLAEHWPQEPMSPPAYERLTNLNANVLFVVGDRDVGSVRAGAEASAARIKKSKVVTIKDADHLPQMEHGEAVNKLLVEYISLNGC
jgi:pimeloyl-ACP methyl ester carboxylesterase